MPFALGRVEPVGRLVEQEQLGVVDDRLGQLDPLALPGAHGADRAEPLLAQADLPQGVAGARGGVPPGQPVELGQVANDVVGGHVGRQGIVLGCVAEAGPHLGAGHPGVLPEHA